MWNMLLLQNRPGWGCWMIDPPFFSEGSSPVLGSLCLPPEERRLSVPEIGEKERSYYLFKVIQTIPTNAHSPSCSLCPVQGTVSQERSTSPWFRLPAPSMWQKGALPKPRGPQKSPQMAVEPGFKSQCQSPSAAPFPAPPTTAHSCQHSGQVWPCGVGPIISKLFWTPLQIPIWGPPLGGTLLHYKGCF